ncbi:MAG TPA: putative transporter small subunit [Enteractinococcus sp.]
MTVGFTFYLLMWPVLVAIIMFVIARGFFKEWAQARREGRMLI